MSRPRRPHPPRAGRRQRGQALVEFALIIPIFLAIVFGAIDLTRVIWTMDAASNAAREAARFAIVRGGSVGFTAAATPQQIKDVAINRSFAVAGTPTVTVCYGSIEPTTWITPQACTTDINAGAASYPRGTPITVVVRVNVTLLTGFVTCGGACSLSGSSLMVVSN